MALALSLILQAFSSPQRRPVLRPMDRSYFAGKLLLVPRDDRPSSLQGPRMIAEIADHDLLTPPVRLLDDPDKLDLWLREFNLFDIDGIIISLERMTDREGNTRTAILDFIRRTRPGLQIYGFTATEGLVRQSLRLVDEGKLDLLLIAGDRQSPAAMSGENAAAREGRVMLEDNPESSTTLLVTRMLNRRFGYSPRIMSVFGINVDAGTREKVLRTQNQVIAKVGAIGGTISGGTAPAPELIVYLHLSGLNDRDRAAFVQSINTALEKNLRVVLVDLAAEPESRHALMASLRQMKLLDRLSGYAGRAGVDEPVGDVVTRAIGQASAFLLAIRFLRDDLDRVRRIDRSQIRLLISRYLSDFSYPLTISGEIRNHARTALNMSRLSASDERLLDYASERVRAAAEELFNDQFRRNVHATLLSSGLRAQFEVRLLQRVQTRIYPSRGDESIEIEITPSVYLVHLGNLSTPLLPERAYWELVGDIDDRILRRWEEINWLRFKVDAESVEMRIRIDEKRKDLPESDEGYQIANRLSRGKRRIEITSRAPAGAFHALSRLEQLGIEGRLASEFQMTESPAVDDRGALDDFAGRWSDRDRADLMTWLGRFRMNNYYLLSTGLDEERIARLLRKADENFLSLTVVVEGRSGDEISREITELAAFGVRRFALPAGTDQAAASSATEAARRSGAGLKIMPPALPVTLCAWNPPASRASGVVARFDSLQTSLPGLSSAADYAWNGNGYSPESSFTRSFELLYDERSREAVTQWNNLTGSCASQNGLWSALNAGAAGTDLNEAEKLIGRLRTSVESISGTRDRGLLRGELAQRVADAERNLTRLRNR